MYKISSVAKKCTKCAQMNNNFRKTSEKGKNTKISQPVKQSPPPTTKKIPSTPPGWIPF